MSMIIFTAAAASVRKAQKCNNGYRWESALKLKLMDGLSKKNNCAGGRESGSVRLGWGGGLQG